MKEMNMEITDSLLAAYVEGNVTQTERDAVRRYLTDHPEELETLTIMMDEDYELDADDDSGVSDMAHISAAGSFSALCYSAAAFVPHHVPTKHIIETPGHADRGTFSQRLNTLLDEIDL